MESALVGGSTSLCNGGQERKVVEPFRGLNEPVITVEFEAFPEAKALTVGELDRLHVRFGTNLRVAAHIGGSEGAVRDRRAGKMRSLAKDLHASALLRMSSAARWAHRCLV